MNKTKVCSKCGVEKDINEFYKSKSNKDGYMGFCKECKNKYQKQYKEKIKNVIKNMTNNIEKNTKKKYQREKNNVIKKIKKKD